MKIYITSILYHDYLKPTLFRKHLKPVTLQRSNIEGDYRLDLHRPWRSTGYIITVDKEYCSYCKLLYNITLVEINATDYENALKIGTTFLAYSQNENIHKSLETYYDLTDPL